MSDFLKGVHQPIITGRPEGAAKTTAKKPSTTPNGTSFGELLQQQLEQAQPQSLTFSRHAQNRQTQRGIELSEADMERLHTAVAKADQKGVTDTLVFMNNTAFIVNVPSRVVVTLMDGSESDQNVFTNIDGAVIV